MSTRTRATIAALLGACTSLAMAAADPASEAARRERMDRAYQDSRNPNPGPAARAETSVKRGAHDTGQAIKHGARRAGHAVGKGVRKTGEAVGRGGKKLENAGAPKR